MGGALLAAPRASSSGAPSLDELWIEPVDLESRDLFHGPGGRALVPRRDVVYRFDELDRSGHSAGYEVEDPDGRRWKVKIGDEAQAEIVTSRLLWAIGYHQPVLHYVREWRMRGGPTPRPAPGRFRLESDHETKGHWKWRDNPFVGTRPLHGLLVANVLLGGWDFTTENNRVYRPLGPRQGPRRWYLVQDVGASLGRSRFPTGTRNRIRHFEREDLIVGVRNGRPRFEHYSYHLGLLEPIGAGDVVWTCRLLARLSDRQLADAFRAADYPPGLAERYIRRIRAKIEQGLALAPLVRGTPRAEAGARPGGRR